MSLDVFRGMTLAGMIFVNYGGGGYWFFNHSPWDGLTFADVIFPFFLWIMGTSMAISLKRRLASAKKSAIWSECLVRFCKLTLIGIFVINNAYDIRNVRFPGVLQRLALCYLIVSTIVIFVPKSNKQSIYKDLVDH